MQVPRQNPASDPNGFQLVADRIRSQLPGGRMANKYVVRHLRRPKSWPQFWFGPYPGVEDLQGQAIGRQKSRKKNRKGRRSNIGFQPVLTGGGRALDGEDAYATLLAPNGGKGFRPVFRVRRHIARSNLGGKTSGVFCPLFHLRTGMNQSLTCQQLLCINYVIKATRAEPTIESVVPHL